MVGVGGGDQKLEKKERKKEREGIAEREIK